MRGYAVKTKGITFPERQIQIRYPRVLTLSYINIPCI